MASKPQSPSTKTLFLLVTYGILLYMALQHLSAIRSVLTWILAILEPVSYGVVIAFVINLFLNFFKQKVFRVMAKSEKMWEQKLCPVLCGTCTALVAAILLAMLLFLIIPQITTAINTLIEKMPGSQEQFFSMVIAQLTAWHAPEYIIQKVTDLNIDGDTALSFLSNLMDGKVETVLGTAFNATASVLSTVSNLVLGLIIAIYILAQKERVLYVAHKIIELVTPQQYQEKTFRVLNLTVQSFANFLAGQFAEAFIIGTLCTIGLVIFRFPYAATIGVLTGITVLLPIIGAWIGGGIGLLLVWVEAPDRALFFLIFFLVLQQLEGQFIYPKVVGNSIGLPGLLVLIAVVLGGGFAGIRGIIVAIPLFAILYTLLKSAIDSRSQTPVCETAAPVPDEPAPKDPVPPAAAPPEPRSQSTNRSKKRRKK